MHEALIQNWLKMIPWGDFWEPETNRQKWIKWSVILLVLFLGIFLFLFMLDDILACEYACENPLIVEGKRKVIEEHYWLTGGAYYDIYLSYEYGGVVYEDVFYRTSKNPRIRWDGIETLTIAVDPNNPGIPIRNMFNEAPVIFAVVLWSLGLSMLIYGFALEFPQFRRWRVSCANRPGFFSRPYGKPVKYTENPDYGKDFVLFFVPVVFTGAIILTLIFPHTFS